jgi:hypothetical protein
VQIGAAPWLHVPVGKPPDDRYLPPDHPLLLPRPNGTALDRHAVTRTLYLHPSRPLRR